MSEDIGLCNHLWSWPLKRWNQAPIYQKALSLFFCLYVPLHLASFSQTHFFHEAGTTAAKSFQAHIFPVLLSERNVLWLAAPIKDGLCLVQFGWTASHLGQSLSSQGSELPRLAQPELDAHPKTGRTGHGRQGRLSFCWRASSKKQQFPHHSPIIL